MSIVMPTLSSEGWVKEPKRIIDRVLTYYQASNTLQSLLFRGKVVSLQRAIFETNGNLENLPSFVSKDLTTVLENYFNDSVSVSCDLIPIDNADDAKHNLDISISVVRDGITYDASSSISSIESILVEYAEATVK